MSDTIEATKTKYSLMTQEEYYSYLPKEDQKFEDYALYVIEWNKIHEWDYVLEYETQKDVPDFCKPGFGPALRKKQAAERAALSKKRADERRAKKEKKLQEQRNKELEAEKELLKTIPEEFRNVDTKADPMVDETVNKMVTIRIHPTEEDIAYLKRCEYARVKAHNIVAEREMNAPMDEDGKYKFHWNKENSPYLTQYKKTDPDMQGVYYSVVRQASYDYAQAMQRFFLNKEKYFFPQPIKYDEDYTAVKFVKTRDEWAYSYNDEEVKIVKNVVVNWDYNGELVKDFTTMLIVQEDSLWYAKIYLKDIKVLPKKDVEINTEKGNGVAAIVVDNSDIVHIVASGNFEFKGAKDHKYLLYKEPNTSEDEYAKQTMSLRKEIRDLNQDSKEWRRCNQKLRGLQVTLAFEKSKRLEKMAKNSFEAFKILTVSFEFTNDPHIIKRNAKIAANLHYQAKITGKHLNIIWKSEPALKELVMTGIWKAYFPDYAKKVLEQVRMAKYLRK